MPPNTSMTPAIIRSATGDDAQQIIDIEARLASETEFLLVSPIDPITGSTLVKASLEEKIGSPLSRIFVAEDGGDLVGIALCRGHFHPAQREIVQLGLGVNETHRRRGIGKALLERAHQWACLAGVYRMQLAVITANLPAVSLYRRAEFEIEGTLNRAARIGGKFYDVYVMAKLLP